ncbi:MAG: folate-binding protein [Cyanobium sp.]
MLQTPPPAAAPVWDWQPALPAAAAWPVSLLQLQGQDSLRFLHGQSSQAIELASPGAWLSTCCISPTARLRALAEVLVDDDGAWLVIRSGDGAAVRQSLDRVLFPADAVRLGPLRSGLLLTPVQEGAERSLSAAEGERWRPLQGGEGFWLGEQLLLLDANRDDANGDDPEALQAAALEPAALEPAARQLLSLRRLTAEEQERWRLQLGLPLGPLELCDDTNPFEVGLAPRVSLSKGCYVGQETLAKLATYDGVRRQLRRWSVPADAAAAATLAPGAALQTAGGERAGQITSSLQLPGEGLWIGLALVRRQALMETTLYSGAPQAGEGELAASSSPTATEPSPQLTVPLPVVPQPAASPEGAVLAAGVGAASSQGLVLQISRPPAFVDPPVGAGGARAAGS